VLSHAASFFAHLLCFDASIEHSNAATRASAICCYLSPLLTAM
jgi:hypothetical protein